MLQACHASRFGLHCLSRCSILKLREDVNIAPAYPTQRAFVVQSHAETDVAQREVQGRAEHIVSEQVTYFQIVEELAQCMVHILTSTTEHAQASDDLRDP
jgi:hypothetical protein